MLVEIIKKHWKSIAILLMLALAYAGGLYQGRSHGGSIVQTETKTTEATKTVAKEDDQKSSVTDDKKDIKADTQRHTKTVIVQKPDGTKTTTITEDDDKKTESSDEDKVKTSENDQKSSVVTDTKTSDTKTTITPVASAQSHYRLGLFMDKEYDSWYKPPTTGLTYGVSAGMRVLGPAWLDAGYNFGNKDVTLGLSIEF